MLKVVVRVVQQIMTESNGTVLEDTKRVAITKIVLNLMEQMATRIHRPLKVIEYIANGIMRQNREISKQLQDLHVDVELFSETYVKHHERSFISNYLFYRTDRHQSRKGGTAVAVRRGVPHSYVDLPPLVSVEATGVCIPIGNSEILLPSI
jgi:hypothetical protein